MARKHLLRAMFAGAALTIANVPAFAAPPIAYSLQTKNGTDLYLVNPDGSGSVLLYSSKGPIFFVDMNPAANQLAVVDGNLNSGFKIIDYSPAGVRQSVIPVNDGCAISGIDFHPTDGSLLVAEGCPSQNVIQVRRWTSSGFDTMPLATFGTWQNDLAIGHARWLGDGSGFLVTHEYISGGTIHWRIERYMNGMSGSPVVVSPAANADFDTARCTSGSAGPCWALAYDDGTGRIHKLHFDSMGYTEDSVQAGSTPHLSPSNTQLLYRLQTHQGYQLKVDNATLVSRGNVQAGIDWRP